MTDETRRPGLTFLTMWFGQTVSLTGSVLTQFALGVWVFQRTGSATQFALINVFILVPQIFGMPFAGVAADRWSRRAVMIVANLGGALTGGLLALLLVTGTLEVWLAYLVTLLFAVSSVLLFPAFNASVPMLVPPRQLGRANGLVQFGQSLARVVSLPLAGVILPAVHLQGIVLFDLATFLFAVASLAVLHVPQPERRGSLASRRRVLREAADGLRYIVPRRGLLSLLLYFAVLNVSAGFVGALFTPMVLSFASVSTLGAVAGVNAAGLVLGSLLMSVWGGPQRKINGVLVPGLALGLAIVLIGARASLPFVVVGGLTLQFCVTIANVSSNTIWQLRVPRDLQGRVLGSVRTISFASIPAAQVVAGPLADHVFEPLLRPGGALTGSVGRLIGVGPGRGMGLILVLVGIVAIVVAVAGFLQPALRAVEAEPADDAVAAASPA